MTKYLMSVSHARAILHFGTITTLGQPHVHNVPVLHFEVQFKYSHQSLAKGHWNQYN